MYIINYSQIFFVCVQNKVVFPERVNKRPGIKANVLAASLNVSLFPYLNI